MKNDIKIAAKQQRDADLIAARAAIHTFHNNQVDRTLADFFFDMAKDEVEDMDAEDIRHFILNDAIPEAGCVTGLIYCNQTTAIGALFADEIFLLFYDHGIDVPQPKHGPLNLNFMVWAAWEVLILGNEELADRLIEEAAPEEGMAAA